MWTENWTSLYVTFCFWKEETQLLQHKGNYTNIKEKKTVRERENFLLTNLPTIKTN